METDSTAIKVTHLSKSFRLPHERNSSIKSVVLNFYRHNRSYETQQALRDLSFEIKKGQFFGIVGRNGSGKSTLLKLLANIYSPTKGKVEVHGALTPFIELGVGFNPELTGRENVYLNGALLGFNHKEMRAMYEDIVSFAELERFMDQKLKNYSSGMQVRLAFSIAIRADSDILLIDEVLAVGDAVFQKKCYNYFKELKKNKKTVVFVSHDTNALLEYCDRGILIENGQIASSGKIDRVVKDYIDTLNKAEAAQDQETDGKSATRWGTGVMRVGEVAITNGKRKETVFTDDDELITITVAYKAKHDTPAPTYGITILDAGGQRVFASNTLWSRVPTTDVSAGKTVSVTWQIPNVFNTGDFTVSPAVADREGAVTYDWAEGLAHFKVRKQLSSLAYINVKHELTVR